MLIQLKETTLNKSREIITWTEPKSLAAKILLVQELFITNTSMHPVSTVSDQDKQ
jgi:hypothetical protein